MDSKFRVCNKCNLKLPPETLVCPQCGAPAPGTFFFSQTSGPTPPARPKRGARFWLGLSGLIGGSLCACLALAMLVLYASGGLNLFPGEPQGIVAAATESPENQVTPTPTVLPPTETAWIQATPTPTVPPPTETAWIQATPTTTVLPPTVEVTPVQPTSTAPLPQDTPSGADLTRFFDDFSNSDSGWKLVISDTYSMDYFQQGNYGIVLRIANKMAVAIPPYSFTNPTNMIISVKIKGDGGNGTYGVICHRQDQNNYYRVSFSGNQYAIDKIIDGQSIELTQPFWKEIIGYQPAADGTITVTLACMDGRIQMLVDDIGHEILTDSDIGAGDAAIFVAAGNIKDENGLYMEAFFDDFSAEIP